MNDKRQYTFKDYTRKDSFGNFETVSVYCCGLNKCSVCLHSEIEVLESEGFYFCMCKKCGIRSNLYHISEFLRDDDGITVTVCGKNYPIYIAIRKAIRDWNRWNRRM